jgi:hypothetical protein
MASRRTNSRYEKKCSTLSERICVWDKGELMGGKSQSGTRQR